MRAGFSLVELAVALVLFGVMGLGAAELLHQANRAARRAGVEEGLLWRATSLADSVGAGELPGSGERVIPGAARLRWAGGPGGSVEIIPWGADSPRVVLRVSAEDQVPESSGHLPAGP